MLSQLFTFKQHFVISFSVICLLLILQDCTSSRNEVVHPDFDRLPPNSMVDYRADISQTNEEYLPNLFHPDSLQLISTIGDTASLDDRYYYENITKQIDGDNKGNLYFTQHHTNSINVYDKNGQHQYTIGGRGKGPGEFLQLISFTFDSNYQTLYVLDLFEIEIFAYEDGRFDYKTTLPHGLQQAFDMCRLGNHLFISGYKISPADTGHYENETQRRVRAPVTPPITRFNLKTLKPEISFGFEYSSEYGYGTYEGYLSRMLLSCNEYSGTVVGYQKDFPFLFGYNEEGQQKWISRTDGIITTQHTEFKSSQYKNAGLMRHTRESGFLGKYPIPTIENNEFELLQYVNRPPTQNPANFDPGLVPRNLQFRTILVNAKTGEIFNSDAYGRIGLMKGNTITTIERDPDTFQRTFYIYGYNK